MNENKTKIKSNNTEPFSVKYSIMYVGITFGLMGIGYSVSFFIPIGTVWGAFLSLFFLVMAFVAFDGESKNIDPQMKRLMKILLYISFIPPILSLLSALSVLAIPIYQWLVVHSIFKGANQNIIYNFVVILIFIVLITPVVRMMAIVARVLSRKIIPLITKEEKVNN